MPTPTWDPSISLGNIIALVTFLFTIIGMHIKNVQRFERMDTKLDLIFDWWRKHMGAGEEKNARD